ncbi:MULTISPECIES: hypothetical protein [unclassified Sphingomonas]|jgi:Chlorophyllase enzyme|uniref:hypothetical protein n=1 Tax=unclassified Sphingomonas TaxID=196159 RepID=UPI000E106A54|nr:MULTISPECIES: hypothetical protein [unclassified Sphingomonas]AXJ95969.1 hypothetical protein DM480_11100 [Sphingomonas sp. FARSPH]
MRWSLIGALSAMLLAQPVTAATYQPNGPIERRYAADGPWATTTIVSNGACDREGNVCDIWYPSNLGANPLKRMADGFRHPVIVFANGTADTVPADKNAYFLRHLASWGFIVIRSRDGSTGQGDTVADAAKYLLGLSRDPQSVFYGKVDADNIGLAGHSQGAATATLLFSRNDTLFKTYVPIETPLRVVCVVANCTIDLGALPQVTRGSIFYVGGDADVISSLPTNLGYYTPTSDAVDKVMGMIALGGHTEIEGSPDCAPGGIPGSCNIGVYPLLGYPTAWFMWKLQGAADGPAAFGADGELAHASPEWLGVLSNVRPR